MSGYTLIIDTSIHGAAIGLQTTETGSLKFLEASTDVADSARQLPLMVEAGLKDLGIPKDAVDRVLVSQGPGSFTGIRVGLGYAIGFLAGLQPKGSVAPVIAGVSSLELFAQSLAKELGGGVLVFLPSTKTTGYLAAGSGSKIAVSSIDLSRSALEDIFLNHQNSRLAIIGSWATVLHGAQKHGDRSPLVIEGRTAALRSVEVMGVAVSQGSHARWVGLTSGDLPRALYLRKSTVEEKSLEVN